MFNVKILCVFIPIVIIITFLGCSVKEDVKNTTPTNSVNEQTGAYVQHNIVFPNHWEDKAEYNAEIYDIKPFTLTLTLPKDWTIEPMESNQADGAYHYLNYNLFSAMDIYSEKGYNVGSVGYNVYELYENAEDEPQAVYNQIAIGNGYKFDVHGKYIPVNKTDNTCTALTDVVCSEAFMRGHGGGSEKINRGIVSYDKSQLVYVAIEFDSDFISDNQLNTIAKSIVIS